MTIVHTMDVRAGGSYSIDVRLPDGGLYADRGTYTEVVPRAKIVSNDGHKTTTITFTEHDGETTVSLVMAFMTDAAFAQATGFGVRDGISKSWNTIERILHDVR